VGAALLLEDEEDDEGWSCCRKSFGLLQTRESPPLIITNENGKLIKYEGIPEIHLSFFSNARKFGNNFMPRKPRKEPPKVVSILFPH
jgi:hypothetical protein